jgi:nicotinamidase-related amidase
LLQLQGAPDHPAPLGGAVLVLIDIQEEYRSGALPLDGAVEAAHAAKDLLALARDNGVPVLHVRHRLPDEAPIFSPRLTTFAFIPSVAPLAGEAVFDKSVPNAFSGTDLDAAIRRTGRHELIVAGMQTHLCVSGTVRAALDLGYRSTVVAAACATRDLPDGEGGTIPAKDVHRTALSELADAFATVVRDATVWRG